MFMLSDKIFITTLQRVVFYAAIYNPSLFCYTEITEVYIYELAVFYLAIS